MMKKGTILLLILTLILSSFSVVSAASGASQVISNFNIMPESCSADSDKLVTRRDFAYTLSNILGSGVMDPRDTEFADVSSEDEDSGYIYYATVNGFLTPTGNLFCPDDAISFHDFNASVVKLLAYETVALSNGGGDAGNMKTAMDLYLYKDVTADNYDTVTVKQYRQLIYNLMTASVADFSYSYDAEGNVSLKRTGSIKTILSEYFGISRYYGSIVEVNNEKPNAKVYVTKNVSSVNPAYLAENQNYYFLSNGKVDLNFYKNIPVEIWVDKDGLMVHIAPQPNVEVFYDVIYSVNGVTKAVSDNYAPLTNQISKIELTRDSKEYKIASGLQISYNCELVPSAPLAGKYAKIVMIDNKITFIETWNLQEGGIITEINNSYIAYLNGSANGRVKNIGEYEDIMVIIEGRSTDRAQLKPNSLFYFYQTSDDLVVVVSEKTIAGKFESYASNEIEIGRVFYPIAGDVYCAETANDFQINNFDRIFNTYVIGYVDIFGNVRYLRADDRLNADNSFTGYVLGYSRKGFEDTKLKIQKVYPVVEEIIVTLPSDCEYYTNGAVYANADAVKDMFDFANNATNAVMTTSNVAAAYTKLFKFETDESGKLSSISEADYFKMFGDTHTAISVSYTDNGDGTYTKTETPYTIAPGYMVDLQSNGFDGTYSQTMFEYVRDGQVYTNASSGGSVNGYYDIRSERFVCIYESDGKVIVAQVPYSSLKSRGGYTTGYDNMRFAMFGEGSDSIPEFVLLYGNLNKIHDYNGRMGVSNYVESITQKYDLATDKAYYEVRLEGSELVWTFDSLNMIGYDGVTDIIGDENMASQVTTLAEGMKVEYLTGALFNRNGVYLTGITTYPPKAGGQQMTIEEYICKFANGVIEAKLDRIADYRIFLLDENDPTKHPSYVLSPNLNIVGLKFANGNVKEESISAAEIPSGATIYVNNTYRVEKIYYVMED